MSDLIITDNQYYSDIADAIREQNGTNTTYLPSEMAEAILALSSGSGHNLPSGYTELVSAGNNSSTRVNTGLGSSFPSDSTTKVEIYVKFVCGTTNSLYLFQSRASSSGTMFGISGSQTGGKISASWNGSSIASSISRTVGYTYEITATYDSGTTTLVVNELDTDTTATDTTTYTYAVPPTNFYIFGNYGGNYLASEGAYICETYMKVDNVEVMHYIPAKSSGSVVGFYDLVSESFIAPDTGSMIAGDALIVLQTKTVTPTASSQTVVADSGYDGLSSVTVEAVPTDDDNTFTANGTYTPASGEWYDEVTVNVSASPTLQTKTVSPSTSSQTITADSGYDGLSSVTVNAMTTGTATTPATTITATPTISVSSSGLITATTSTSDSVTPTVSAGYIDTGTSGTITVTGSATEQLTTQAATTITPTTTSQTAVASGVYTTGAITVDAIDDYKWWGYDARNAEFLYEADYNCALSDTNWSSLTPSSSSQTLTFPATTYSSSAAANVIYDRWGYGYNVDSTDTQLDFSTYDYFIIEDLLLNIAYTSTESSLSLAHAVKVTDTVFIPICQRPRMASGSIVYPTSSTYGTVQGISLDYYILWYRNASNVMQNVVTTYGFYFTPALPSYYSTGALKVRYINFRTPSLSFRSSNTYHNLSAYNYIDADNTEIKIRQRFYRVEKTNAAEIAYSRLGYMYENGTLPTESS